MANVLQQVFGTVYRGAAFSKTFNVSGTPGSLSGWTLKFVISRYAGDTGPLFETTSVTVSGTDLTVTGTAAETEAIPAGQYVFGLVRTNAGSEEPLAAGSVNVADVPGLLP